MNLVTFEEADSLLTSLLPTLGNKTNNYNTFKLYRK